MINFARLQANFSKGLGHENEKIVDAIVESTLSVALKDRHVYMNFFFFNIFLIFFLTCLYEFLFRAVVAEIV